MVKESDMEEEEKEHNVTANIRMKKSKHGLFRNSSLYLWKMDHRMDASLERGK